MTEDVAKRRGSKKNLYNRTISFKDKNGQDANRRSSDGANLLTRKFYGTIGGNKRASDNHASEIASFNAGSPNLSKTARFLTLLSRSSQQRSELQEKNDALKSKYYRVLNMIDEVLDAAVWSVRAASFSTTFSKVDEEIAIIKKGIRAADDTRASKVNFADLELEEAERELLEKQRVEDEERRIQELRKRLQEERERLEKEKEWLIENGPLIIDQLPEDYSYDPYDLFYGSEEREGLVVWRIMERVPVEIEGREHGIFKTSDCYLVLYSVRTNDEYQRDLHFWIGKNATMHKSAIAAFLASELFNKLNGNAVQYRELQGEESDQFLQHFIGHLKYVRGSSAVGMKNITDLEIYNYQKARLIKIKSSKFTVSSSVVPTNVKSLRSDCCFILDAGKYVYVWIGKRSTGKDKLKVLEIANRINHAERRSLATIVNLEDGKEEEYKNTDVLAKFWELLGGARSQDSKKRFVKDEDEAPEEQKEVSTYFYKIEFEGGSIGYHEIEERPLRRKMLDSNCAFVLDCETEMFVWHGMNTSTLERENATALAQKLMDINEDRPEYVTIDKMFEGNESILFMEKFSDAFDENDNPDKFAKRIKSLANVAKTAEEAVPDSLAVLVGNMSKSDGTLFDDGSGMIKIWRIEDSKTITPIKDHEFGHFFDQDCYIVSYEEVIEEEYSDEPEFSFDNATATESQGTQADDDEEAIIAALQKSNEESDETEGEGEPQEEQKIGGYITDAKALRENTNLVRAKKKAARLPKRRVYFWSGIKSKNKHHLNVWKHNFSKLPSNQVNPPELVDQPQYRECDHFLKIFQNSFTIHSGAAARSIYKDNRLFRIYSRNELDTRAIEVPLSATSLQSSDCYMLETNESVYLWIGTHSGQSKIRASVALCEMFSKYLKNISDVDKPAKIIEEGDESDDFWSVLNGKQEYSTKDIPYEGSSFYLCSYETGAYKTKVVGNYTRLDLSDFNVCILDTSQESVFMWVGKKVNKNSNLYKNAQITAELVVKEGLLQKDPEAEEEEQENPILPENRVLVEVRQDEETQDLKDFFVDWNAYDGKDKFVDPYEERRRRIDEQEKLERIQSYPILLIMRKNKISLRFEEDMNVEIAKHIYKNFFGTEWWDVDALDDKLVAHKCNFSPEFVKDLFDYLATVNEALKKQDSELKKTSNLPAPKRGKKKVTKKKASAKATNKDVADSPDTAENVDSPTNGVAAGEEEIKTDFADAPNTPSTENVEEQTVEN